MSIQERPANKLLWGIHDPHIFRDPASGIYYLYCTHRRTLRSRDLVLWEELPGVIPEPPAEALEWTGGKGVWAPDIACALLGSGADGLDSSPSLDASSDPLHFGTVSSPASIPKYEYRLYCSNSSWGVRNSCIYLAVADSPEGPFVPRGIVVRTSEKADSPCNAIDANVITDEATGKQYLTYGSFWGGIYQTELDPATGLSQNGPDALGICIARRPLAFDGAIEGAYLIRHPDTDLYYLFVSYGSLNSDYHIRVGRSKSPAGPFFDHNGREMTDVSDLRNELGLLPIAGYRFEGDAQGLMGPGHCSVLRDADGSWYLFHHVRPHNFHERQNSFLQVRELFWTEDGWPIASPEPYAGVSKAPASLADARSGTARRDSSTAKHPTEASETYAATQSTLFGMQISRETPAHTDCAPASVSTSDLPGLWDYLKFRPAVPQALSSSVRLELRPDGSGMLSDSVRVKWVLENAKESASAKNSAEMPILVLSYAETTDRIYLRRHPATKSCGEFFSGTGIDDAHLCVWLKKIPKRLRSTS